MKTAFNIARVELQVLFYSPIAWFILIMFTFQVGMFFCPTFGGLVTSQAIGNQLPGGLSYQVFASRAGIFGIMQGYLYLYIPLITMGLMSRELGSGSIKLLYSSPVSNCQIILGKFISMMIYGLVLIGILFCFVLFAAFTIKSFDFPLILSGLLGVYLLICAYAAVGLFMSSLTSYQVVAAMLTLAVLAVLNYVKGWWQDIDFVRDITWWLALSGRSDTFVNGLICSEDFIYFLLGITLFLMFAIIKLKAVRQKSSWIVTWGKYIGVFVLAALLGYISSRPKMMFYYDVTETKMNTLTENSQEIMAKMKGGLTITTYVNLLDKHFRMGLPEERNRDLSRFNRYTRFKPEIDLKYVYYYDKADNKSLDDRYPTLTDRERMIKIANNYDLDSNMFLRPEEIRQVIDLSGEKNRFVRQVVRESGEKTFLRVFDDAVVFPTEAEITAAFKRLVMDLPTVGFLKGHGERGCLKEGDRDYNIFAWAKTYRYALINSGFDVKEISLNEELPEKLDILVIADMKTPLSENEMTRLNAYIERGGNLLIVGEPRRQEVMNPLVEQLGVRFLPGQLVRPTEHFLPDLVLAKATPEANAMSYLFNSLSYAKGVIAMPGCTALEYVDDKGYDVIPLFVSDSARGWNELQTVNFIDDKVELNPETGEVERSYVTALALSRQFGEKRQKIVVLGDADCLSNVELSRGRANVKAANYILISGIFYWLSDEEVPIDVRRPPLPDNEVYIGETAMEVFKIIFKWILPIGLLIFTIFMWIRRRGK